jgi:Putative Flp pilus-assembly TadE/G-like
MVAIALIPVIGSIGAAVDYARVADMRMRLSNALVAGLQMVGSKPKMSDAETYAALKAWLDKRMGPAGPNCCHLDSIIEDGGTITAAASGTVETLVTRIVGLDHVAIGVTRAAVRTRAAGQTP